MNRATTAWKALRRTLVGALSLTQVILPFQVARGGPLGGQVTAGSATIQGQGTSNTVVNQASPSAIINWNTFNLGTSDALRFLQPGTSSVVLNRVTGNLGPSQILGTITANGRVFVVNPDGFLFGSTATINTGSFLATTHDIADQNFMSGKYLFNIPGNPSASIQNSGTITAGSGGFAALVAPSVRNDGVITANLGAVALGGAGKGFTLDLYGDSLIKLYAGDTVTGANGSVITNTGKLQADGGTVLLTAAAAQKVLNSVINTSGVAQANSVGLQNGKIVFGAQTAKTKPAGSPTQTVAISGTVQAAGQNSGETGGTIEVTGEAISLTKALMDASGQAGGGTILIGGDFGGGNPAAPAVTKYGQSFAATPVPSATSVTIDSASVLNASAGATGNGGKVVVWSDNNTAVGGTILAKAGTQSGSGGFVETSGQALNIDGLSVSTAAPNGKAGTWLLDPADFTIGSLQAATINGDLTADNVVVLTDGTGTGGSGDIVVTAPILWSSNNNLTLDAYHSVLVNADITTTGDSSGLLIFYNDGGTGGNFLTGPGASVTLSGATPLLAINGQPFTLIRTANNLQNIPTSGLPINYAIANNIDLSGIVDFTPIGNENFSSPTGAIGVFDGLGHTISHLTISVTNNNYLSPIGRSVGLFDVFDSTARNLVLSGGSITATGLGISGVGAFAGYNTGSIVNVSSNIPVTAIDTGSGYLPGFAGGLVGDNYRGTIANSNSSASVTGPSGVGGLVGANSYGTILNSHATGSVSGLTDVGGLVGINDSVITTSYASGPVTGNTGVGGLIGYLNGAVDTSFATGTVTGQVSGQPNLQVTGPRITAQTIGATGVGGLVGLAFSGSISNSYAVGDVLTTGTTNTHFGFSPYSTSNNFYAIGGLLGGKPYQNNPLTVVNSYSSGNVTVGDGGGAVGGLVGLLSNSDTISNSFAAGNVTAGANAFWLSRFIGGVDAVTPVMVTNSIGTGAIAVGLNSQFVGDQLGAISDNDPINNPANWPNFDYPSQVVTANLNSLVNFNALTCGPSSCVGIVTTPWDFTNTWYQPTPGYPLLQAFQPSSSGGTGGTITTGGGSGGSGSGGTGGTTGSGGTGSGGSSSSNTSRSAGAYPIFTVAIDNAPGSLSNNPQNIIDTIQYLIGVEKTSAALDKIANEVNPYNSSALIPSDGSLPNNCISIAESVADRMLGKNLSKTADYCDYCFTVTQLDNKFGLSESDWHGVPSSIGAQATPPATFDDAFNAIKVSGSGAVGFVLMRSSDGSQHIVAIANIDGAVGIVEAQNVPPTVIYNAKAASQFYNSDGGLSVAYAVVKPSWTH